MRYEEQFKLILTLCDKEELYQARNIVNKYIEEKN